MRPIVCLALGAVIALLPVTPALACGPDSDCLIGTRTYRIQMPQGVESPGAIVFAHGYRGSAAGTMKNRSLRRLADELGVALVAVNSPGWRIPGVPSDPETDGAEELAYFEALVPTLRERHGIDTGRMMLTGFSSGGMVTWQIACDRGALFAAYAPIAGTFWRPGLPESCASKPVDLIHVHGAADRIVPLEGRRIRTTHQGSVTRAMAMMRRTGGYAASATVDPTPQDLSCERMQNRDGRILELCIHGGGHKFATVWVGRAWRAFERAGVF